MPVAKRKRKEQKELEEASQQQVTNEKAVQDILRKTGEEDESDDDEAPQEVSNRVASAAKRIKSAWVDPDDAGIEIDLSAHARTRKLRKSGLETIVAGDEYEQRLRQQFRLLHGEAGWADKAKGEPADDEDEDSEAEQGTAPAATSALAVNKGTGGGAIPPHQVDIERYHVLDLEIGIEKGQRPVGKPVIQALQFHPSSDLLLVGGLDSRLRLFAVSGGEVTKLSSHYLTDFRVRGASFTPTGEEVLLTSDQERMIAVDVNTGTPANIRLRTDRMQMLGSQRTYARFRSLRVGADPAEAPGLRSSKLFSVLHDGGTVMLCDLRMKQMIRTLRMPGQGVDGLFSPEKDVFISADTDSFIYEWDLGTGRCLQRVKEPWAVKITSLAISKTSTFSPRPLLAVGTQSGVVDLLDFSGPKLPKSPLKGIDNLTMPITSLRFHPKGELMLLASVHKTNHLRLVHAGTMSTYQNWPAPNSPFARVAAIDFSKDQGLVAIGNKRGMVHIYQLQHYMNS